jgi:hypothetical protein
MPKKKAQKQLYVNQHSRILIEHTKFIYEVEIYVNTTRSWYLYDTKIITLIDFKPELTFHTKKERYSVCTYYKLLAAPKDWLEEHNFKQQ